MRAHTHPNVQLILKTNKHTHTYVQVFWGWYILPKVKPFNLAVTAEFTQHSTGSLLQLTKLQILWSAEGQTERTNIYRVQNTYKHNTEFLHQVDGGCLYFNEDCRVCSEILITAYRPGSSLRSACRWPGPGGCTCCGSLGGWSPRRGVQSEPLRP